MTPLQQRYYDILMERCRNDRYPSHQLLNRLEAAIFTPDQMTEYIDLLLAKTDESWYPSGQILDRIDRMLQLAATAA
jgi:hypothetical protein